MIKKGKRLIFVVVVLFLFIAAGTAVFNINSVRAGTTGGITATIRITVCGNGIVEADEQCDVSNLDSQTCLSRGFAGGTLSCSAACEFNTSGCTAATPTPTPTPAGGGGGGGGGGWVPPPIKTTVNFTGKAYPKSEVTLLKDAQIVGTTIAGADSNFQLSATGLTAGNYIFSAYSEDNKGMRSPLLTFPLSITSGTTTNVSGIFIAPTIGVDKSEVRRGDDIGIFGQSAPRADIVIAIGSEEFFAKTISDINGIYLHYFDTAVLDYGLHHAKSKASISNQLVSSYSRVISFKVGAKTVIAEPPKKAPPKADINNDSRVNLVDFSVAAYWYKRPSPPATVDLNGDGKVDLVDFSIMAYYWTG